MVERIELDIESGVEELAKKVSESGAVEKGGAKPKTAVTPKEKAKGAVEMGLMLVARRITTARSVGELAEQLNETKRAISADKDPGEVDGLRAAIMLKLGEVTQSKDTQLVESVVADYLKKGQINKAIDYLRKLGTEEKFKTKDDLASKTLDAAVSLQKEINGRANARTLESLSRSLEIKGDELSTKMGTEVVQIQKESSEIEQSVIRSRILAEKTPTKKTKEPKGKVERKKDEVDKIKKLKEDIVKKKPDSVNDNGQYLDRLLKVGGLGLASDGGGDGIKIDVERLTVREAILVWGKVNTIRGAYRTELGDKANEPLRDYLDDLDFELNEHIGNLQTKSREATIGQRMVIPGERTWEDLPPEVRKKFEDNLDFMERHLKSEDLLRYYEQNGGLEGRAGGHLIKQLFVEQPDLEKKFKFKGEQVSFSGSAEEYFELCRREVYKIRSSVPEEQLSQLVFVKQARLYMELMSVDTEGRPDLKIAKDAVTKTLYMEFALKSLWKAGGNQEAWQRAAGILLREGPETNFFKTMRGVRERIRGKFNGEDMELLGVGFNIDDIMTMAELEAPNGQSWNAYLSPNNMGLAEKRLKEFGKELARQVLEKAKLRKPPLGAEQYSRYKSMLASDRFEMNGEQLGWMRNYMQYMMTATGRVGESLWLMDSTTPDAQYFDYSSGPGGQYAQKTGLHAVLYYSKYHVTKYGYEALGKLFLPIHSLLSYARAETWGHFLGNQSGEAWIKARVGGETIDINVGSGANEFFFEGKVPKAPEGEKSKVDLYNKFFEEMMLDETTGKSKKMKGMRAYFAMRKKGAELMAAGKHKGFVDEMNFSNMEAFLGYEIPGRSKEDKFKWMIDNFGQEMMMTDNMPSKREGDFINKYSPYFAELTKELQSFLNSPSLAGRMKMVEIIEKYNNGAVEDFAEAVDKFLDDNREIKLTLKKNGNWWNPLHYLGPDLPMEDKEGNFVKTDGGNRLELKMETGGAWDNWYLGRGPQLTRQEAKEGTHDPLIMKKIEIQNLIAWGTVDPATGAKMMREWQKDIYFGSEIEIKGRKFRAGMIPFLTPALLFRGWWVDRLGLDWEDFKIALRKNNEEAWEKLKKIMGI